MSLEQPTLQQLDCELCIVGAGYAALNALNAAAKYLKKGDRVVVIDKNATWGGHWLHQYDFLRLHQPYRMFAAGDQPWKLAKEPSHLAVRHEVLDYLSSVPMVSAGHLALQPLFEHAYSGHQVRDGRVEAQATPLRSDRAPTLVRARKLLKATGNETTILPPLGLSSERVRSVSVADPVLQTREFLDDQAPIYVVGGGKTAMDCVRQIGQNQRAPRRQLNVITGSGMWFFRRDTLYPSGVRRHFRGAPIGDLFMQVSDFFDGRNEQQVMEWAQQRGYVHKVWEAADNCRLGLLSSEERLEIRRDVHEVFRGHLVDVEGTKMVVREGNQLREREVAKGAWFINCTSHWPNIAHEPVLQDDGLVCAPQFAFGSSGGSAYYATHLWFADKLAAVAPELFRVRLDVEPRLRYVPQLGLMTLANTTLATAHLSAKILTRFKGDLNKWYPLHRQLPMLARVVRNRRAILAKADRLLTLRYTDSRDVA